MQREMLLSRGRAITHSRAKRAFDVAFASAGLLVTAPFAVLAAIAVKLDSPGPVFYGQMRSGLHGRPFHAWKFCGTGVPRWRPIAQ